MKMAKMDNVVLVLALGVFGWLLYGYSQRKNTNYMSSLGNSGGDSYSSPSPNHLGQNSDFSRADGLKTNTYGLSTPPKLMDDPSLLLPNDTNKEWANLNPQGNGNLKNANLLSTTFLVGADTVGSSKKNMNLQVRSEPIIPQNAINTGPWQHSTIEPDLMRRPLEIGQGAN
jgi:hypothetical protein